VTGGAQGPPTSPSTPPLAPSRARATEVLRACGLTDLTVTDLRPLTGGMIYRVEEWFTDGQPASVVSKCGDTTDDWLQKEAASLYYMRQHSELPVPEVYGHVSGPGGTYLLLERLPGRHFGEAKLTEAGREAVLMQLAEHLARLHMHHGDAYGYVMMPGEIEATWLGWFGPRLESNYQDAREHLSAGARAAIERLLSDLPARLSEPGPTTLVHGDVWQNNLIVDDTDPDHPRLTGFIDGGAMYTDVEYELAYLQCFGMVGDTFFQHYAQWRQLRDGHAPRFRIYWLNTMLLHLWLFGEKYLARCEELAREVGLV
jgi:fructosamine-3-kinase